MIKLSHNKKQKLTPTLESELGRYQSRKQIGKWHVWRFGNIDYIFDTTLTEFCHKSMFPEHSIEIWVCEERSDNISRGFISGVWGEWSPQYIDVTTYLATWKTLHRRRFSNGISLFTVRTNPYKIEVQPLDTLVSQLWSRVSL